MREKTMNLKSEIIADCGNLPLDISNLICDFLRLRIINKNIACWDSNLFGIENGKIITSNKENSNAPSGEDFISISASRHICVALRSDGTLEFLLKHFELKYYSPDDRFVSVTAIHDDVIGIRLNGSIISMKKGEIKKKGFVMFTMFTGGLIDQLENVIGLKDDGTIEFPETDLYKDCLPWGSKYVSIASGYSHILTLREDGSLYTLNYSMLDPCSSLDNIPNGSNFISIAAADEYSAALTDNGIIYLWGGGYSEMRRIYSKDCIDIAMSNRIIVGLKTNGDIVKFHLSNADYLTNLIRGVQFE